MGICLAKAGNDKCFQLMEVEMSPQEMKGQPCGAGDLSPVSSGSRTWGPGTVGMGTSQALQAVGGSKFTIRWSVKSDSFNPCLSHQCPWLCPWDCLVSLSWYSSLQLGETSCCYKKEFSSSSCISCSVLLRPAPTCPCKYIFPPVS